MYILGICNDETASACLMKDGRIVAAASEERFSRIKMDSSFPNESIKFCLDFAGIAITDIEAIAYAWHKGFSTDLLENYLNRLADLQNDDLSLSILKERIYWELHRDSSKRLEFDDWIAQNIDVRRTQVMDFYHHEAHAASASFLSPFNSGIVLTADGRGDFESTTIWRFDRLSEKPLTKIYSATSADSLGYFYGRITGLLGYRPMRHEGKITGLAAFGNPKEALQLCKKMIDVVDGKIISNLGPFYVPFFQPYDPILIDAISKFPPESLAAAAQLHLETMLSRLLEHYLVQFSEPKVNLMCAGGVFGNVRVTQRLKELPRINSAFVQPQMGDGGLCLGAASLANERLSRWNSSTEPKTKSLNSMFLGPNPKFPESTNFRVPTNIFLENQAPDIMARSLNANKVIGLIQGRMEFGPRALCNRSILYKTSDTSINDWLNKRMRRTEFMPFAPVIRREKAREIIKNYKEDDKTLDFMTSTVEVTEKFKKLCPAVVHVDNTARPQLVSVDSHPFIWKVLQSWENLTGELSLVNTSFNAHEEPIISSVAEGIAALDQGIVDELWVLDKTKFHVFTRDA